MLQKFIKRNLSVLFIAIGAEFILKDFLANMSNNFVVSAIALLPVLCFPLNVPNKIKLLYGFFVGFIVDILFFTPGLFTSIFVFIAFTRELLLKLLIKNNSVERYPSLYTLGFSLYVLYLLIMFLLYFIGLSVLEFWDFYSWMVIIGRILVNVLINTALILLMDYFVLSSRQRTQYEKTAY